MKDEKTASKKAASKTTRSRTKASGAKPTQGKPTPKKKSTRYSVKSVKKTGKKSYYLTGELIVATQGAIPVKGTGTMNTPQMVVDSNGNQTMKTMIELEIDGHRSLRYLDAEEAATVMMVLGVLPDGEF